MRDAAVPFEGFPFIIGWEFTVACNLRCRHCGSSAGTPRTSELTTKEALALCDQFPELCVREVDFTGGEPLLRPDWPIVAARVVELGIAANILTNGLLIKPSILSQMKDIGIGGVGISLDGLEATHDSIRARPGSFAAVLAAIDAMQRAEMPFNVITTVNALNLPELPRMLDLLASLGVGFWRLQAIIPMGRVVGQRDLPLDPPSVARLGFFIQRHAASAASRGLRIICSDGLEYTGVDGMDAGPWQGCSAGIVSCGITSDGKVKGCLSMPDELAEGDLRSSDLWGIWFHPDSFAYTRKFRASELGPHCSGCEKAEECRGGCSSSSFCSTGRFHNDTSCFHKAASSDAEPLDPGQTRTLPHARSSV